jgi:hypothetical protein
VFPLLVLSLALQSSTVSIAKSKRAPVLAAADPGYASALAAANHFLQAWQNQDHETVLLMLSDAAKQASSEARLNNLLSPGSDAAYEIARGKKLKTGGYTFPVALFPSANKTGHSQRTEIVVVHAANDEWTIDKMP